MPITCTGHPPTVATGSYHSGMAAHLGCSAAMSQLAIHCRHHVLCCAVLYCTVLHCTALHCTYHTVVRYVPGCLGPATCFMPVRSFSPASFRFDIKHTKLDQYLASLFGTLGTAGLSGGKHGYHDGSACAGPPQTYLSTYPTYLTYLRYDGPKYSGTTSYVLQLHSSQPLGVQPFFPGQPACARCSPVRCGSAVLGRNCSRAPTTS